MAHYMDNYNIEYEAFLTEETGDTGSIARKLIDGVREPRYIIVVGSDGTMNEVLDGVSFYVLLGLGYIPAGSGNDLARDLHMPRSVIRCLKRQLTPRHFTMIDYGVLSYGEQEPSYRRSLVSAGIGCDAAMCQEVLTPGCRQCLSRVGLDKFSHTILDIRQFFRYKSSRGYIALDGIKKVEFNNMLSISYRTQPSEGSSFLLAPKADRRDGEMNVCVVGHATRTKLIPVLLLAFISRRGRQEGIRNFECREITIHTEIVLPVHAGGKFCGPQIDIQVGYIAWKVRMAV